MLNPFPDLLAFSFFAPLFLRATVGIIFMQFGFRKIARMKHTAAFFERINVIPGWFFVWFFGLIEIIGGIMLFLGVFTQIAALVLAFIIIGAFFLKRKYPTALSHDKSYYILLAVTTFSLIFLGAGAFAIDLPL